MTKRRCTSLTPPNQTPRGNKEPRGHKAGGLAWNLRRARRRDSKLYAVVYAIILLAIFRGRIMLSEAAPSETSVEKTPHTLDDAKGPQQSVESSEKQWPKVFKEVPRSLLAQTETLTVEAPREAEDAKGNPPRECVRNPLWEQEVDTSQYDFGCDKIQVRPDLCMVC